MTATATHARGSALVTGGARRIGAAIVRALHTDGWRVLVHCHRSQEEGLALVQALNASRPDSALLLSADLSDPDALDGLAVAARQQAQDLALLVNNASVFFPTPVATASQAQWQQLTDSNLRAPFFLSQALAPLLTKNHGSIVNMVDIYAERPLRDHAVYAMTKAGLASLTQSLARELAPAVRVNGVSPGAILWPEQATDAYKAALLEKIPLQRIGTPEDIAGTVLFLAGSRYITGQILAVDGGRSLHI
ncbi:MAG: pteridine reductase [Pseudomonadota bacterium]